jgi:UDP-N-acetylenolpyruvoylglucosamine reductase
MAYRQDDMSWRRLQTCGTEYRIIRGGSNVLVASRWRAVVVLNKAKPSAGRR